MACAVFSALPQGSRLCVPYIEGVSGVVIDFDVDLLAERLPLLLEPAHIVGSDAAILGAEQGKDRCVDLYSERRGHPFSMSEEKELQQEFHVEGACDWILAVGSDFLEAESAIHGDGVFHDRLDGVEAHAAIADLAGFGNDAAGEGAS